MFGGRMGGYSLGNDDRSLFKDDVYLFNDVFDAVYRFSIDLLLLLNIESLIFFFCYIIRIFSFARAIDDDKIFSID